MNKDRRKALDEIMARIEAAREELESARDAFVEAKEQFDGIAADLEGIKDEEQEYFDAMPESLQSGEKGQNAEAAIEQMDNAVSTLREVYDLDLELPDTDSAITAIDEAKQG